MKMFESYQPSSDFLQISSIIWVLFPLLVVILLEFVVRAFDDDDDDGDKGEMMPLLQGSAA